MSLLNIIDDKDMIKSFLKIDKICMIIGAVIEALEILHSVGYVHNDLKPSKITTNTHASIYRTMYNIYK